jgi:hypothetical protein
MFLLRALSSRLSYKSQFIMIWRVGYHSFAPDDTILLLHMNEPSILDTRMRTAWFNPRREEIRP